VYILSDSETKRSVILPLNWGTQIQKYTNVRVAPPPDASKASAVKRKIISAARCAKKIWYFKDMLAL
jgi:hypothetical protein